MNPGDRTPLRCFCARESTGPLFFDLVIAGLIQGFQWRELAPWESMLTASTPFWFVRTISGAAIIVGQAFFIFNVLMTWVHRRELTAAPRSEAIAAATPRPAV